MGKVNKAIIGAIAGLTIVSAKVWYAIEYHKPSEGFVFYFSPNDLLAEKPFFWIVLGLFWGAIVGVIVGAMFDYLGIVGWRIINTIYGAIFGFITAIVIFLAVMLIEIIFRIFFKDTLIEPVGFWTFYIWIGLLEFFVPGVIIGAIVGFSE